LENLRCNEIWRAPLDSLENGLDVPGEQHQRYPSRSIHLGPQRLDGFCFASITGQARQIPDLIIVEYRYDLTTIWFVSIQVHQIFQELAVAFGHASANPITEH